MPGVITLKKTGSVFSQKPSTTNRSSARSRNGVSWVQLFMLSFLCVIDHYRLHILISNCFTFRLSSWKCKGWNPWLPTESFTAQWRWKEEKNSRQTRLKPQGHSKRVDFLKMTLYFIQRYILLFAQLYTLVPRDNNQLACFISNLLGPPYAFLFLLYIFNRNTITSFLLLPSTPPTSPLSHSCHVSTTTTCLIDAGMKQITRQQMFVCKSFMRTLWVAGTCRDYCCCALVASPFLWFCCEQM